MLGLQLSALRPRSFGSALRQYIAGKELSAQRAQSRLGKEDLLWLKKAMRPTELKEMIEIFHSLCYYIKMCDKEEVLQSHSADEGDGAAMADGGKASDVHETEYGAKPDALARAPARFHLIGEHSWFFRDKTLSMAADLYVYVAVSVRNDLSLRFYFPQMADKRRSSIPALKFRREDKWANVIKAVISGYIALGYDIKGLNVTVWSRILPSAGFGITSAIKAASSYALYQLFDGEEEGDVLAAIEIGNRRFLGLEGHLADNFAALYSKRGNLILTDHAKRNYELLPYPFSDRKIMLVDARVPRIAVWNEESLQESTYALLLGELREVKRGVYGGWQYIDSTTDINEVLSVVSESIRRKLLCIIREHKDVLDAYNAIMKGDFARFARAVNDSHKSMRDLYDISCPEIDWIVKRVSSLEPNLEQLRNYVTCSRITGKGFGRCVYAFIRNCDVQKFKAHLSDYERLFGFHPECYEVHTADGTMAEEEK